MSDIPKPEIVDQEPESTELHYRRDAEMLIARHDAPGLQALLLKRRAYYLNNKQVEPICPWLEQSGLEMLQRNHVEMSLVCFQEVERVFIDRLDDASRDRVRTFIGMCCMQSNQYDRGMAVWREMERSCRKRGDLQQLAMCLTNQASFMAASTQRIGEASLLTSEAYMLATTVGPTELVQQLASTTRMHPDYLNALTTQDLTSLGELIVELFKAQNFDEAMVIGRAVERRARDNSDVFVLAGALFNQASILRALRNVHEPLVLLSEAEKLFRNLGNRQYLVVCLANKALLLEANGSCRHDALAVALEAKTLAAELGKSSITAQMVILIEALEE